MFFLLSTIVLCLWSDFYETPVGSIFPSSNVIIVQQSHFVNLFSPIIVKENEEQQALIEDSTFFHCKCDSNEEAVIYYNDIKSTVHNKVCSYECCNPSCKSFLYSSLKSNNGKIFLFHSSITLMPDPPGIPFIVRNWMGTQNHSSCNTSHCCSDFPGFHHDTSMKISISYLNIADYSFKGVALAHSVHCTDFCINYINVVGSKNVGEQPGSIFWLLNQASSTISYAVVARQVTPNMNVISLSNSSAEVKNSYLEGVIDSSILYTQEIGSATFKLHIIETRYCGSFGASISHSKRSIGMKVAIMSIAESL